MKWGNYMILFTAGQEAILVKEVIREVPPYELFVVILITIILVLIVLDGLQTLIHNFKINRLEIKENKKRLKND